MARDGLDAAGGEEGLEVLAVQPDMLADLGEPDPALINEPAHEARPGGFL